jgi:hypothetical protein
MTLQLRPALVIFAIAALCWVSFCYGQDAQPVSPAIADPPPASLSGAVVDQSGAVIAGARIVLTRRDDNATDRTAAEHAAADRKATDTSSERQGADHTAGDQSLKLEAISNSDGQFFFPNVAPGPFQLTVTSVGFEAQTSSGILHAGEVATVPPIALAVATNVTDVEVGVSRIEIAEEQIKFEEKQRVFGAIPNFYVSYFRNAVPLTPKQKFELAWKSVIDPITFAAAAGAAGVEQWQGHFEGYGQGTEGFAKRFGADYANAVAGTFVGEAILPALLKQDPRYFYKGTGSKMSRSLYAISMAFICKGDNGKWQPNYSGIIGSLAAGGISNIYYPAQDRDGAELTFENAAIDIAANAATNILQEFLIKKLTPKVAHGDPNDLDPAKH